MNCLDYESLQIGYALPELQLPALDRTTLALFAGASGDHNPIHIDIDFARKAGASDVFAHGMLPMAWLGRLLTNWVPQHRIRKFNARFVGITHLGNSVTCRAAVVEKLEYAGERLARIQIQASNQWGETKIVGDALISF